MNTEKLRKYCLSFPGATEGIKWEEHLCFMVAEKIFVITGFEDNAAVVIKVPEEEYETLCEREEIVQASHMARNKWISVQKRNALKPKEWEYYLRQSYELVKAKLPKKVREGLVS